MGDWTPANWHSIGEVEDGGIPFARHPPAIGITTHGDNIIIKTSRILRIILVVQIFQLQVEAAVVAVQVDRTGPVIAIFSGNIIVELAIFTRNTDLSIGAGAVIKLICDTQVTLVGFFIARSLGAGIATIGATDYVNGVAVGTAGSAQLVIFVECAADSPGTGL